MSSPLFDATTGFSSSAAPSPDSAPVDVATVTIVPSGCVMVVVVVGISVREASTTTGTPGTTGRQASAQRARARTGGRTPRGPDGRVDIGYAYEYRGGSWRKVKAEGIRRG